MAPKITPAHDQKLTIHLVEHVPAHGPRGRTFRKAKRRMKALGLDKCAIIGCDTGAPVEYHHWRVEHAWGPGVSRRKFNAVWGLHLTDEELTRYIEEPGNLEPLCSVHHRTQLGVHAMPEPLWNAVRVWRDDMPPPAEHV